MSAARRFRGEVFAHIPFPQFGEPHRVPLSPSAFWPAFSGPPHDAGQKPGGRMKP
jgi:hypothetical protein